jgi:hypothetical protein
LSEVEATDFCAEAGSEKEIASSKAQLIFDIVV